jgi:hypothetical protein
MEVEATSLIYFLYAIKSRIVFVYLVENTEWGWYSNGRFKPRDM